MTSENLPDNNFNMLESLLQTEVALSDLLRKDECTLMLYTDGLNICADIYYKGTCIATSESLTTWESLSKAIAQLYPTPPGTLDKLVAKVLLGELDNG